MCVLIYWYEGRGAPSLGGLAKLINVVPYRRHKRLKGHLLPYPFRSRVLG
jgi:hypothetical protein